MRALVHVASRELRAYAPAWIAALVAATFPWLAPLLPMAERQPAADVRLVTAALLAALLGLLVALFAGAGLLARDLGEGRMGFFLALPLRAATVWGGRLLAAAVLVYATIAVIVVPPALAAGGLGVRRGLSVEDGGLPFFVSDRALGVLFALLPLVVILLAHQLATALRSRSVWLLADLAALALAGAIVAGALTRLAVAWATTELLMAQLGGGLLAITALAVGGAVGLGRGGVLLARVHRAQAIAVAAGLLATAAATAGFASWVLAVDAGDVTAVRSTIVPSRGPWIAALGNLRHRASYRPWMLVDPTTGGSLPLSTGIVEVDGNDFELAPPVVFADDGASAAWVRWSGVVRKPHEVVWIDLGEQPRLLPTGIELDQPWFSQLLPAGDRLAVASPRRLSVWAEQGRRLLAAAELPRVQPHWQQLRWLGADRLRLARFADADGGPLRLQVFDLDAAARRLATRVDLPLSGEAQGVALSADGARVLLVDGVAGRGGVSLLDATTGATLAQLAPRAKGVWVSAGFLPGARVAVATGAAGSLTLRLFDREGKLLREIPLGAGRWAWLGAPWSADLLPFAATVRATGEGATGSGNELRTVDLATGRVRVLGGQLSPVLGAYPWMAGDDRVAVGSPASRLFRTAGNSLVRVDDEGRQTPVLPRAGGSPAGR